jgi:ArsR family transcriptional regulator
MESLDLESCRFDQALLLNVLTYAEHPEQAIREAARVLRPGGTLVVVTLSSHAHADVTAAYGHVHPGFAPAEVTRWLTRAGLHVDGAEVTSRERRKPYFEVLTAIAEKKRESGAKRNGKKENG